MSALTDPTALQVIDPAVDDLAESLTAASELIQRARTCLVISHEAPDGDAIGSTLAMALLLRRLRKTVVAINADEVPYNFSFLSGADAVVQELEDDEEFDLACILDSASDDRLGPKGAEWVARARQILVIDHHRANSIASTVTVLDRSAAAVGELVYRLAVELRVPLDSDLAECLYTSLFSDTGGFRYRSTTPNALRLAGCLVAAGVDTWKVASQVYESNPVERVELLAHALQSLQRSPCGRLALIALDYETLHSVAADEALTDGLINHARGVRGVEIAAQLLERAPGQIEVTLRSRDQMEVAPLARRLGGSGGRHAGRCLLNATLNAAKAEIMVAFDEILEVNGAPPASGEVSVVSEPAKK